VVLSIIAGGSDDPTRRNESQSRLKSYFNRAILGPKLLIVYELGYLPFGRDEANLFFSVSDERGSMILTSNLSFTQWPPRWQTIGR